MGLFLAFSENGTSAICFFKKKFEIFPMVLFWNRSYVVHKKGFLCGVFESWKIKKAWWCTQLFAVFFIGF
jgi:hypothetical protein